MLRSYLPHIMQDVREPFTLAAIGTTVFEETRASDSFPRVVQVPKNSFVIEYQLYWEYDIQHLYDLEHIWVTVENQCIVGVEASFHGRYLTAASLAERAEDGRPILYCQPGKHAFLPLGELFSLLPDADSCCREGAGKAGFLVAEMFSDSLRTNAEIDKRVCAYLKSQYAFQPSWRWEALDVSKVPMMPFPRLKTFIVNSITEALRGLGFSS